MKYCSTHCRSNAIQFAADQRGRRRGRLATIGSMQCLFESSDPRVGIVVLKLGSTGPTALNRAIEVVKIALGLIPFAYAMLRARQSSRNNIWSNSETV